MQSSDQKSYNEGLVGLFAAAAENRIISHQKHPWMDSFQGDESSLSDEEERKKKDQESSECVSTSKALHGGLFFCPFMSEIERQL